MRKNRVLEVIAATEAVSGQHSSLYVWMFEHFSALEGLFSEHGPNWKRMAEIFAEEGLVDGDGNPPSRKVARDTFYRVKARKRKERAKRRAPPQPIKPAPGVLHETIPPSSSEAEGQISRMLAVINERSGRK